VVGECYASATPVTHKSIRRATGLALAQLESAQLPLKRMFRVLPVSRQASSKGNKGVVRICRRVRSFLPVVTLPTFKFRPSLILATCHGNNRCNFYPSCLLCNTNKEGKAPTS